MPDTYFDYLPNQMSRLLRPRRKPQKGKLHVPDGFPHYSTVRNPGMCMCLQECCQGDSGCICLTCPCRHGRDHDHTETMDDVFAEYSGTLPSRAVACVR